MEIPGLAGAVVSALVPYFAMAGGELAKGAGKAAASQLGALYALLRKRFKKGSPAAEALKDMAANPKNQDMQTVMKVQLEKQMASSPDLEKAIRQIMKEIEQDPQGASFLTQIYGGEVGKIINIDNRNQHGDIRID